MCLEFPGTETLSLPQPGCYVYPHAENLTYLFSLELFPHPELKATDSEPIEGSPVLLSCETQLPLARWDTPLQFIFFRDDMVILSDWNRSSELQIPTIWIENSGLYGCSAETLTHTVYKHSSLLEIRVQSECGRAWWASW